MDILASKLLPNVVYPLGLAALLGLLSVLFGYGRWYVAARRVAVAFVATIWLASAPAFADWAVGTLEAQYSPTLPADTPEADVIVILGGMMRSEGASPACGRY